MSICCYIQKSNLTKLQTSTYCIFCNTIVYSACQIPICSPCSTLQVAYYPILIAQKCRFSHVIVHLLDDVLCIQKYSRYTTKYSVLYIPLNIVHYTEHTAKTHRIYTASETEKSRIVYCWHVLMLHHEVFDVHIFLAILNCSTSSSFLPLLLFSHEFPH